MIHERIALRADRDEVALDAYLLKRSFQPDHQRPAVVICPGGGYFRTSDREAEPVALRFLGQGYHVFVLRYSVRTRFPEPMLDLAATMMKIRSEAEKWHVDRDQIAVCGFSAGGHLAASLGVFWNRPFVHETLAVDPQKIKPNALILGYPVIDLRLWPRYSVAESKTSEAEDVFTNVFGEPNPSQEQKDAYSVHLHVSKETPRTFLWHTADDEAVSSIHALRFACALAAHHVPYELHVFESGIHGLSLGDETTDVEGRFLNSSVQVWIDLAAKWLKRKKH